MSNTKLVSLDATMIYSNHILLLHSEPEVFFSESEIVVNESETSDVCAQFTILREGTDLSKTSVVSTVILTACEPASCMKCRHLSKQTHLFVLP